MNWSAAVWSSTSGKPVGIARMLRLVFDTAALRLNWSAAVSSSTSRSLLALQEGCGWSRNTSVASAKPVGNMANDQPQWMS